MKLNKKIMIYGLMMIAIILAGSAIGYGVAIMENLEINNKILDTPQDNNDEELKEIELMEEGIDSDEIIINEDYFFNAPRDPYTINNVELDGDILKISVSYSGGCKEHDFTLIGTTILFYSVPEQTHILLSHDANNDTCEVLLTEELTFNLSPFKKLFQNGIRWPRTLIIWLDGFDESIIYEFGDEEQMLLLHISLDKEKYLVNESIFVTATLENNLDASIVIGELGLEVMTLDFEITTPDGELVHYIGPGIDFTDSITLEPKETVQVTYNLLEESFGYEFEYDYRICDFQTEGTYSIGGTYNSFCTNEDAVEITITSNIENFIIIDDS